MAKDKKTRKPFMLSLRDEPIRKLTQEQTDLIDQLFDDTKESVKHIMEHASCYVSDAIRLIVLSFGSELCDIFMHKRK